MGNEEKFLHDPALFCVSCGTRLRYDPPTPDKQIPKFPIVLRRVKVKNFSDGKTRHTAMELELEGAKLCWREVFVWEVMVVVVQVRGPTKMLPRTNTPAPSTSMVSNIETDPALG